MKKRIRLKKEKKRNLKRMNPILESIVFTITKKVFGNGYFVFSFEENSICWFWLKEFPEWKFGIWLYKNKTYDIFGENVYLIDKFKPSYSYVSCNNVEEFNSILKEILSGDNEEHNKYLTSVEREKSYVKRKERVNFIVNNTFKKFIKEYNKRNKSVELALKDYGQYSFPRYDFYFLYDNKKLYLTKEEQKEVYLELGKVKSEIKIQEEDKEFMEDYICRFDDFQQELLSEEDYKERSEKYDWEEKSFQKYFEQI